MSVSPTLMQAILAMDSYNQGYNAGLDHGGTQISNATLILMPINQSQSQAS